MLRYGVFHLGDAWVVMGGEGEKLDFADRRGAIDAARLILSAHRACGEAAELLVQDESGRLSKVTDGSQPRVCPTDRYETLVRPSLRPGALSQTAG